MKREVYITDGQYELHRQINGDISEKLKKYFDNSLSEEEEVVYEYKYIPK